MAISDRGEEQRRAARLAQRATFGARPGELTEPGERAQPEIWLAEQRTSGPDPALQRRLRRFPSLDLVPGELLRDLELPPRMSGERAPLSPKTRQMFEERRRDVIADLVGARVVRAVHARQQLREVMVDFWSNHFSVFARKGAIAAVLPHYERQVLERHALGRFADLLRATARSPAMLFYLDNWMSTAPQGFARRRPGLPGTGINENYARELLELHTLGVDGGYTQDDVGEVARVFTGWTLESRRRPVFRFRGLLHDPGRKTVLGLRVRGDGVEEGEWLLAQLARHPSTARNLSRKLCERFVCDDPPAPLVERVARRYLDSDGDIGEVVSAIFLSPEFIDPEHRKLKTPLRFVASTLRSTAGETEGDRVFLFLLSRLGEVPYFARTPAGHPEASDHWIDPSAMLERMGVAFALASGRVPGARLGSSWPEGTPSRDRRLPTPEAVAVALASPEFQWT